MQLQLKELVKTHTVINQAWEAEKAATSQKQKVKVSEEAQKAFAIRLAEARKKAELLSIKRAEEEANILRSWHQKRLRLAIDKLSQIPENENEVKMLPQPSLVTEQDLQTKEAQASLTIEDCKTTLLNVNAARIKVNANLKMSKTLLETMQNLESKRKNHNMFVFGPNPIFNSAKEHELNYSITNQF